MNSPKRRDVKDAIRYPIGQRVPLWLVLPFMSGKIFATLGVPDLEWGTVNLTPEEQRAFMAEASGVFKPCNGAWGERGYTHVHLPKLIRKLAHTALAVAKEKVSAPRSEAKRQGNEPPGRKPR